MENKKNKKGGEGVTASVETITPAVAEEFLAININNRHVDQRTVDDYATQMKKGLWTLNGEPIIISSNNTILDGQHRLLAVVKSNTTIQSLVVWGVDGNIAFATIDTGKGRSAGDMLSIVKIPNSKSIASGITQYFNLSTSGHNATILGNSLALRTIKRSKAEVVEFYDKHADLLQAIQSNSQRNFKRMRLMQRSAVFALELYLILDKGYDVDYVFEFFDKLFSGEGVENKTILLLRDRLIAHITKTRLLTNTQRLVYIIKTWNAYVTGVELKLLRYRAEEEGVPDFLSASESK